jgi:thymidylate synthase
MHLICRNVNDAYQKLVSLFKEYEKEDFFQKTESRNGPVVRVRYPLTITYENPRERVLFDRTRDCNPFFHLYESVWMLAGRRDVESLKWFVPNMANYSDNGKTFNGAYGYRWIHQFEQDQLEDLILLLKGYPNTRRAVLQMWDCVTDLRHDESCKDIPCNLVALFEITDDPTRILNMTVFNRSNDAIWGMLGANAVHFSILQEYLAAKLGVQVGVYHQISNNAHIYLNEQWEKIKNAPPAYDYYASGDITPSPLIEEFDGWESQLIQVANDPVNCGSVMCPFLEMVSLGANAYALHKQRAYALAQGVINKVVGQDWQYVMRNWLYKRERNYNAKTSRA